MSAYSNQLAWAAKTAQKVLAPMVDPDGTGVFTLNDTDFTGVIVEDPNMLIPTPNNVQKVYGIRISATKPQFDTASLTAAALATLAGNRASFTARGKSWTLIEATPGAQHYNFVGVIA